jgi:hypothetical protein
MDRSDSLRRPRATDEELQAFEYEFGPIPPIFRWFLSECGGGVVGAEWVDGIHELPKTHRKFRAESIGDHGWRMKDVFVIGWDGSGNPYGIDATTGKVVVEDHDFGGIHEMAPSFDEFLREGL